MDTTDICRVCMEDDGDMFCSLFNPPTPADPVTPSVMIADCAGIVVDKGDGLPEVVCCECVNALKEAYKIREKCRKTDRKLRKILNLAHKNHTIPNAATENCQEQGDNEVVPCSFEVPDEPPAKEETDVVEEPVLDIKSELQIDSHEEEEEENPSDSPNLDKQDSNAKCSAAECFESNSNQESAANTENPQSSLILVKQEQVQQKVPNSEQDYLVEELKEIPELAEHSKSLADEYEDEHADEEIRLPSNCDEVSINDEEQSMNMEVEVLENDDNDECDEYEDYEAIDEDLETEDFDTESSIEVYVCCGCPMEFPTSEELDVHSKSIHLPESNKGIVLQDWFMCDICYRRHSSLKALNSHKRNRINRKLRTCPVCQLVLNSVRKKRHHEQLHKLLPEDFGVNCCGCDQVVPFKQLGSHAEQVHKNTNQPNASTFICEVCFLDCGFKQRLDSHQSKQAIPEVVVRKQTQPEDSFVAPLADIDGKQRFVCDICEKTFSTKGNLKSHRALHGPLGSDKPFKCAMCGKDFSKKSNYNVHMLRAHSFESSFPCTECPKRFKCSTNLKIHMRVHTREKPYRCGFCPKAFGYLSDKRRHEIVHSGNYPFKCDTCGKQYTRRTLLNRHLQNCGKRIGKTKSMAAVKDEVVDQPDMEAKQILTCDLCDEWFTTMEDLADHHAELHVQTLDEGTYDAEVEVE